jgi:hypothetical protein
MKGSVSVYVNTEWEAIVVAPRSERIIGFPGRPWDSLSPDRYRASRADDFGGGSGSDDGSPGIGGGTTGTPQGPRKRGCEEVTRRYRKLFWFVDHLVHLYLMVVITIILLLIIFKEAA